MRVFIHINIYIIPTRNVVFIVCLCHYTRARVYSCIPIYVYKYKRVRKKKNQINDLFSVRPGTAKSRLLHFNVIPSAFATTHAITLLLSYIYIYRKLHRYAHCYFFFWLQMVKKNANKRSVLKWDNALRIETAYRVESQSHKTLNEYNS